MRVLSHNQERREGGAKWESRERNGRKGTNRLMGLFARPYNRYFIINDTHL
jgi:hypothetical protein